MGRKKQQTIVDIWKKLERMLPPETRANTMIIEHLRTTFMIGVDIGMAVPESEFDQVFESLRKELGNEIHE